MLTPKEWLIETYNDKAELFDVLYQLFKTVVTDEMVEQQFASQYNEYKQGDN